MARVGSPEASHVSFVRTDLFNQAPKGADADRLGFKALGVELLLDLFLRVLDRGPALRAVEPANLRSAVFDIERKSEFEIKRRWLIG